MRSAALIFGLLAGLLGGGAIAVGNLETGLAASALLGSHGDLVAKAALYVIVAIGLLGAGVALFWPRVAGFLMLLSAVAWLLAAFIAGHGAVLFAALPFIFISAGGLVALFARRNPGRELVRAEDDRDFAPRWADEDEADDTPAYAPRPRGLRGRNEPEFGAVQRPRAPTPPPYRAEPVTDDFPPEEDYVDADEAIEDEEAEYEDAEDEQPEDEQALDDEPDDEEPRAAPPRQGGRRQGQWSLPDPEQSPAPQRARQRYVPERQAPPPTRRQPAPPREEPRPGRRPPPQQEDFDIADQDFAPQRREFQPRPRNDYREFEPYDPDEREGARRSPLRGFLRLLILLIFILIVAGIAAAIYFDYEQGPRSILFGNHQSQATAEVTAQPAADAPATPTPQAATPAPDVAPTPVPLAAGPAATPAPASDATAPATSDATAAPATTSLAPNPALTTASAAPAPPGLSDPFKYCQSVDTVDTPDSQYTGPEVPAQVATTLGLPQSAPASQAHWRCANQDVLACNTNGGAACDLTPTVDLMLSYCAQHPDAQNIPAPNGSWSCNGKHPVIPRDQKWPVDARGFYPGAWKRVAPPGAAG